MHIITMVRRPLITQGGYKLMSLVVVHLDHPQVVSSC